VRSAQGTAASEGWAPLGDDLSRPAAPPSDRLRGPLCALADRVV